MGGKEFSANPRRKAICGIQEKQTISTVCTGEKMETDPTMG
jgi:hypothetical protein